MLVVWKSSINLDDNHPAGLKDEVRGVGATRYRYHASGSSTHCWFVHDCYKIFFLDAASDPARKRYLVGLEFPIGVQRVGERDSEVAGINVAGRGRNTFRHSC